STWTFVDIVNMFEGQPPSPQNQANGQNAQFQQAGIPQFPLPNIPLQPGEAPSSPFIQFMVYTVPSANTNDNPPTPIIIFTQPFFPMGPPQKPRASESAMKALPIVKITDEHTGSQATCPICLDQFMVESVVRQLPCQHMYCEECIFEWLRVNNTCPMCRKGIESEEEEKARLQRDAANNNRDNGNIHGHSHINNSTTQSTTPVSDQRYTFSMSNLQHNPSLPHHHHSESTNCAFAGIGCCGETDTGACTSTIALPQCHHRFHASCLRTNLLVEGYSLDSSRLDFRCPMCRTNASVETEALKLNSAM
ncbi:3296_t:CDS:2, partial [Paraglomus occultum]